jgi:hypothetical protein
MVKSGANSEAEKEYHSILMFQAGNILPILKNTTKKENRQSYETKAFYNLFLFFFGEIIYSS